MLKQYSLIYFSQAPAKTVWRFDTTASDREEALAKLEATLKRQVEVIHTIEHEAIDNSQPWVKFLGRLYPDGKGEVQTAGPGCALIAIACTPETSLDEVRHELWERVLYELDLGDVTQCDPYLLDEALSDADVGGDCPFDLRQWPYDIGSFALVEVDKQNYVSIDWEHRRSQIHDELFDAMEWMTRGTQNHQGQLHFALWPGTKERR